MMYQNKNEERSLTLGFTIQREITLKRNLMKSLLPPLMKIIEIYSIHLFKLKHIIKSLKVVINEYIVTYTIKFKSKTKIRNIYVLLIYI